ncbi:MAG TPA: DUF3011 domain-containing protein [Terriglobia bacterium]|nr:DUF3011 domain-containing protein [Terriglobia bacterium]
MRSRTVVWIGAIAALLFAVAPQRLFAQATTVTCSSTMGERQSCPADTSAGVALQRSLGTAECLLGKTWGYGTNDIWVSDGCSGEFVLGQATSAPGTPSTAPPPEPQEPIEQWSVVVPGKGFLVGRTEMGELYISVYALTRYLNQLPANQTFIDHLGVEHTVDTRNDIFSHRVMVFLKGWIALPKLRYVITLWTVNTTDQKALFATVGYQFSKKFSIYGGLNALPGTRSLIGSHPYWLAHDRVMADEFFRPFFTHGVWASGEAIPGLWYSAMVGNNLSALGITASQLTRSFATGGSVWWMPTTKEFGLQGRYGDWEYHEHLATRFGISTTRSREDAFSDQGSTAPDNTTIRLADSLNLFEPNSLAPGVTVRQANYRLLSFDAGMKYKGVFLQTEVYHRWLDKFDADGPLPVTSILDKGFYVQGAFYPVPKKLELYAATSQIYGDKSAGFGNSNEYLGGLNYYIVDSPNYRFNVQAIRVNRSPVSSSFGYYIGGQKGTTVSVGFSMFF